ncbi:hypothetical protein GX563_04725 [Candidatus Bathyarchaeota archaeon]|nr:hypothetical protein [Candidatus Bathyarchaeota archaeon]
MNIKDLQRLSVVGLAAILLLPAVFVTTPALAEPTCSVMITSSLRGSVSPISVPIIMDGQPTGHSTPWNFTGLTGVHNFTVPYEDSEGHPFRIWNNDIPNKGNFYTTITLSAENASATNAYNAWYDLAFNKSTMIWPQNRYFVTPNDPAVIAAAGNMTWNEILDWIVINITPDTSIGRYLFPNETLALNAGVCREFSGLAVSMLEARGYTAYVVAGNTTGHLDINHAWIALELNGTLYHYEPQNEWDNQPEPVSWANNRTAWYFYNDKVFIPATATIDLPTLTTETYKVTILASSTGNLTKKDQVQAQIFLDGKDTGFMSPHTFWNLKDNHTFTVAFRDGSGNPFYAWTTNVQGNRWFPSIVTTEGGTYCAIYFPKIDLTHPSPAQMQYFITPQDKAVVVAASDKNWSQIVDYISSLARIRDHENSDPVLFPNQTLNGGYYLPDYALLCCSMLLANGYTAYYAGMTENPWTAWVVIDINGTLTSINPYRPMANYIIPSAKADYFANHTGMYPAIVTEKPIKAPPTPTPSAQPSTTSSPSSTISSTSPTAKPTPTSTSNPNTPPPSPTEQPQSAPEPSATVSETPAFITVIMLLAITITTLILTKKRLRKSSGQTISSLYS